MKNIILFCFIFTVVVSKPQSILNLKSEKDTVGIYLGMINSFILSDPTGRNLEVSNKDISVSLNSIDASTLEMRASYPQHFTLTYKIDDKFYRKVFEVKRLSVEQLITGKLF